MGNLGFQEILLIMILALIVFGPKRLPEIGRQIGRAIREVKKVSSEFEREVKTNFAIDEHQSSYVVPPRPPAPPSTDVGTEAAAPGGPAETSAGTDGPVPGPAETSVGTEAAEAVPGRGDGQPASEGTGADERPPDTPTP